MIFIESLIATAFLYLALRRNLIKEYSVISWLMLIVFLFSLFPSLSIPYIIDDVDHFHNLALALRNHQVIQWLFAPHNEHVVPVIKSIYLLCYQHLGLDPEVFHLIVLGICAGIIILIYKLILALTQNPLAALTGGCIMAASNLTDDAIFIGTNSHIFFCMFFFLLLFYAVYQYARYQKSLWYWTAVFSILIVPSTFALGLTSIIFVFLFVTLCLADDLRPKLKNLWPLLCLGWFVSLIPYLYAFNTIIHTDHYKDVHAHNILGVVHFVSPLSLLGKYVAARLIPGVFTNMYMAFGLFFLCAYTALAYTKEIAWKRIAFFALFGLFNNFIIFIFRGAWGAYKLDTARYYVFPLVMLACCYPLILDIYTQHKPQIKKVSVGLLVYLICFFAVIYAGLIRYKNSDILLKETMVMQNLDVNFKKAFGDYFQDHPAVTELNIKDGGVTLPAFPWPPSQPGMMVPIARYKSRLMSFYACYMLPPSINSRIHWGKTTDPDFLAYLKDRGYNFLINGDVK